MSDHKTAFIEKIYRENHEGFLRFLTLKCHSRDEAQDVLQEAFQKLINHDALSQMENPRAYLYRTAVNIIIDRQRKNQHQIKFIRDSLASTDMLAPSSSTIPPERQIAAKQELAAIYNALNKLPEKCKTAFLLHREKQLKYSEIATKLDVSVSMVEKYIIKSLKHLRKNR